MWIRRLIRLITIISVLFSLIGFFPLVLNIIFTIRDNDLLINHKKYTKRFIFIDSLTYNNPDGADATRVDGYSSELDNYKTMIVFGQIKNENFSKVLEMDSLGNIHRYVWYRKGIKYAYPAEKKDTKFPIKKYLCKMLRLPILWLLLVFISYIMIKISKKKKMFDKPKIKRK